MDPHIVILAGGLSSRMKRHSDVRLVPHIRSGVHTMPKAMLRLGKEGRPFLDYLLFNIQNAGYRNVAIVTPEADESIEQRYEDEGSILFPFLSFSFVPQQIPPGQSKPPGTADALLRALRAKPDWKGKRVTVCNSDNLYSREALQLLLEDVHAHALIDYDRAALQFPESRITEFAVIIKDREGFLSDIVEKPSKTELEHARDRRGRIGVSMNLWRFSYGEILPYLESLPVHPGRMEKELPSAVKTLVLEHPKAVYAIPVSQHVVDLTSQIDIRIVQRYLQREFPGL